MLNKILTLLIVLHLCLLNSSKATDADSYEVWIKLVNEVYQSFDNHGYDNYREYRSDLYQELGYRFYQYYQHSGNVTFLVLALNELNQSSRDKILMDVNPDELDSKLIKHHIERRVSRVYSPELLSVRSFELSDIYLFHYVSPPVNLVPQIEILLDYWLENLPDVIRHNPTKGQLMALTIGYGYFRINQLGKIAEIVGLLPKRLDLPPSHFTVFGLRRLAFATQDAGFYTTSIEISRDILIPTSQFIHDNEEYLRIRLEYANTLFRLGYVMDALREYEYVRNHPTEITDDRYRTALENNLAISYLNSGNFNLYVQLQLEAYESAVESGNLEYQLYCLRNLFIYHRRQNEHDLALSYLTQALELAHSESLINELSPILTSLGVYHREVSQDYESAVSAFAEAAEIARSTENYLNLRNAYIELSETYLLMQEYQKAEDLLSDVIEEARLRQDDTGVFELTIRKARVNLESGDIRTAYNRIRSIEPEEFRRLRFNIMVMGYNILKQVHLERGELSMALEYSNDIIPQILDWLRESADLQTGHLRMDTEFTEAFGLATRTLLLVGRTQQALMIQEELRSISKVSFFNNPLLKSTLLTEEELLKDYVLSNRIQRLREELRSADETARIRISNLLLEATTEKSQLINSAFTAYTGRDISDTISRAQKKLRRNQQIIHMNVFRDELFIFAVTRNDIESYTFNFDSGQKAVLEQAIHSLTTGNTDLEALHKIYTTYFSGLIAPEIDQLFIIPDDLFYQIPFEVLPVNPVRSKTSYGSADYTVEKYTISYLNSVEELITDKKLTRQDFNYDFSGFGIRSFDHIRNKNLSTLPFAINEVENARSVLSQLPKSAAYFEEESNEYTFREKASQSKVLHIATHSEIAENNPLFSVIYMHPSNGQHASFEDDGLVHAYELFEMNIASGMIVLSSCNSGTGNYLQGAGVLGFSRALNFAGAESIVMNLWPVRDMTSSEITHMFYRYLNKGYSKTDALQKARIQYMNTINSNPYLWGSLVLFGDTSPLVDKKPAWFWWLASLAAVVVVLFLLQVIYFRPIGHKIPLYQKIDGLVTTRFD